MIKWHDGLSPSMKRGDVTPKLIMLNIINSSLFLLFLLVLDIYINI